MYNVNTSFSSFCSANGLDILLKVIQTQVDYIIENSTEDEKSNCDSLALIKSSLRLLIRMMESSDTADGLRNLVESSIPHTIKKIMQHHDKFKPSIFSLVVNVATTFIHNEPTSLSVLQEIQLPQTFLSAFATYQHPVCEVLVAAVHAFGAICLNSAGLEMFYEANPLPQFFHLMTAPSFVTNASDVGNATVLGTAMDELIRHHPKLKGEVFKCANQLLQQVIEVGSSEKGKPLDNCHELVYENIINEPPTERAECLLLGFVDLASRVGFLLIKSLHFYMF
jgi:E3 ubiquitin-protein ligase HUWE1